LLEWALRENLLPSTNNDKKFRESKEDALKYAELVAMLGNIIQLPGMTDAGDAEYKQFASVMTQAASDVAKASRAGDAELARSAVGRIDQACNKCHESYR
jgi:Cytochrome C'